MDFSFGARDQVRLLDGGIGTWLASQDEAHAVAPHQACIKNPSLVSSLHKAYTRAGAQALQANAWLALHLKEAEAERTDRAVELSNPTPHDPCCGCNCRGQCSRDEAF